MRAAFLLQLEQVERGYPQAIDDHVTAVRADCQKTAGDFAAGRKTRQQAIAAGSDNAAFYNDEAKALHSEGQFTAALALLQQAKQRGIDNDVTRAIEADILQATGRGQEAQAQRLAHIAAGGTNPVLYNDAAYAMLQAGDAQGAIHLLQQAQARGVGDDFTVAIYANALQQSGQLAQAVALRQQKIDGNSRHVVFYNDQARDLAAQGQLAAALAVLALAQARGLADDVTRRLHAKFTNLQQR